MVINENVMNETFIIILLLWKKGLPPKFQVFCIVISVFFLYF